MTGGSDNHEAGRGLAQAGDPRPALRLAGLSKRFGATVALADVDIDVGQGEVRGLVGRNGSGKSTLIKILAGFHEPDAIAAAEIGGREVDLPLRGAALKSSGLSFVHQDLALLPEYSILDNVRIGRYATGRAWRIRWGAERRRVKAALEQFGVETSPDALVGSLGPLERALVAIIRALTDLEAADAPGLLVLDEPTAYLPREEVGRLFDAVRRVAARGTAVLFVSHRLDEVLDVTDRLTVLRDGQLIATVDTASTTESKLVELIVGRSIGSVYPASRHERDTEPALILDDLSGATVTGASLALYPGEILGLTGLRGMGHDEVPYLAFGATPATGGTVDVGRERLGAGELTPRGSIRRRMVFLPADRPRLGGIQDFTLRDNVSLPILDRFWRRGRLSRGAETAATAEVLAEHAVRPADPLALLQQLSGGNQQRALVAKWLQVEPVVHMFHEPTAGVDISAKKYIFERIELIARDEGAVMIASEEWGDLAHLCDRVLVFQDGAVEAELVRGNGLSEELIAEAAYATKSAPTSVSPQSQSLEE